MSIFNNEQVSVAVSSLPLFKDAPNPTEQAMIASLLTGKSLTADIIEQAFNGLSHNFEQAYDYAKDNYYLGLPTSSAEYIYTDTSKIEAFIQNAHKDKVVKLLKFGLEQDEASFLLNSYLKETYNYKPNNKFVDFTPEITAQFDANLASVLQNQDNLTVDYSNLIAQVPANSNNNFFNSLAGQSGTRYEETTYTYNTGTSYTYREDRHRKVVSIEENAPSTPDGYVNYSITIEAKQVIKITRTNVLRYVANIREYYTLDDGTTLSENIKIVGPTILKETVDDIIEFEVITTDSYEAVFDRKVAYYYIEYALIDETTGDSEIVSDLWMNRDPSKPALNSGTEPVPGDYFPIIPLRKNNEDLFSPDKEQTNAYQTSMGLLDKLNINVLDIVDGINENPDIAQVDHAYFTFGVNLQTTNPSAIAYLFNFWDWLSNVLLDVETNNSDPVFPYDPTNQDRLYKRKTAPSNTRKLEIKEGGFDAVIKWNSITTRFVQGTVGPIGSVNKEMYVESEVGFLKLQKQLDKDTYKEIIVVNPVHLHDVYQNHLIETSIQTLVDDEADTNKEATNNFIVPIKKELLDELSLTAKNEFFYDSLHLVFYSYEVTKLKWYETEAFRIFTTIAAVVVFITTGVDVYSTFTNLLAQQGAQAALIYLVKVISINIVIKYGFQYLVDIIGAELGFIVAIVSTIIALTGSSTNITANINALFSDKLLELSIGINKAIQQNIQEDIEKLNQEIERFTELLDEKEEEIERLKELLDTSDLVNPFMFTELNPIIDFNESPSQYYDRAVHNINVGPMAYDYISNFVDINLQLPQPRIEI